MLGQPVYMLMPDVVGVELTGSLAAGVSATDAVLQVTETLRAAKVVGKLVEFFGGQNAQAALGDMIDAAIARQAKTVLTPAGIPAGVAGEVAHELNWLNEMTAQKKPFMALTHCMCGVPQ